MNREQMAAQLIKLRKSRLRKAVGELKKTSNYLDLIEQTRVNATTVAREAIRLNLRDLGLFGEIRLSCTKLGNEAAQQILHHSESVMHAQKMTEHALAAHARIVCERRAAEEACRERDSEQFFSWKRYRRG